MTFSYIATKANYGMIERGSYYKMELPKCPNCKDIYFHICQRCGFIDKEKWYLSYFNGLHFFHIHTITRSIEERELAESEAKDFMLAKIGKIPRIWSLLPGQQIRARLTDIP